MTLSEWLPAAFGVLGTLIGALVGGGVTIWVTWIQQTRATKDAAEALAEQRSRDAKQHQAELDRLRLEHQAQNQRDEAERQEQRWRDSRESARRILVLRVVSS